MAARAKKFAKIVVKTADSLVNLTVLITILLLLALAFYAIWDSNQVYTAANARQYEIYRPSEENTGSFDELRTINPEVFSWLTVYGTNIDYPVTQGPDNMKYVNTNVYGDYSLSGAIFLDFNNSQEFTHFNSILYGHHMEKQAMFGELDRFSDKSFFDSHLYGNLYYAEQDHGLEFFAFIHTDAYDFATYSPNIQGQEAAQEYLQMLLYKAKHKKDIGVSVNDRIILLSTCSSASTNGRDILAARITDTVFTDLSSDEKPVKVNGAKVDAQIGIWTSIPILVKIAVLVFLFILLLIVISIYIKIKKGQ